MHRPKFSNEEKLDTNLSMDFYLQTVAHLTCLLFLRQKYMIKARRNPNRSIKLGFPNQILYTHLYAHKNQREKISNSKLSLIMQQNNFKKSQKKFIQIKFVELVPTCIPLRMYMLLSAASCLSRMARKQVARSLTSSSLSI